MMAFLCCFFVSLLVWYQVPYSTFNSNCALNEERLEEEAVLFSSVGMTSLKEVLVSFILSGLMLIDTKHKAVLTTDVRSDEIVVNKFEK